MSTDRDIRKLNKRITGGVVCPKGCHDCCTVHAWTWEEWQKIADKRYAPHRNAPCPYATEGGCDVYEQRPVICRLYGACESIGSYGPFQDVKMGCKRNLQPQSPMPVKLVRFLFQEYVRLIHREANNTSNYATGPCSPLFAGPYGNFIGRQDDGCSR